MCVRRIPHHSDIRMGCEKNDLRRFIQLHQLLLQCEAVHACHFQVEDEAGGPVWPVQKKMLRTLKSAAVVPFQTQQEAERVPYRGVVVNDADQAAV